MNDAAAPIIACIGIVILLGALVVYISFSGQRKQ
jgi:hypothetical protein